MGKRSVLERLEEKLNELTPGQKSLANYILLNYNLVPIMSSVELSKEVGVSDATVIRLCQKLGFSGYTEFKNILFKEQSYNNKNAPVDKIISTIQVLEETNDFVAQAFQNDLLNLKETIANFKIEEFEQVVDYMVRARKIFIVGLNSCESLAYFLYFHLKRLGTEAELINSGGSVLFERLSRINEEDILITISFPRYSVDSLNSVKLGKKSGSKVITITDTNKNSLAINSDFVLIAKSENSMSFINSLIAPMAICNVLILFYAFRIKEKAIEALKKLESCNNDKNLYL